MPNRRTRWLSIAAFVLLAIAGVGAFVAYRNVQPGTSVEAFCGHMVEAQDLDSSLATLDVEALRRHLAALRSAQATAPDEVAADVAIVADLAAELTEVVSESPRQATERIADALRDSRDELDAATRAGQAVEAYTARECGLSLR